MMDNNQTNELNNEQKNDKIVGMFVEEQQATRAIEQLKAEGISTDQISVIAKDKKDLKHISEETGTKAPEGIATGATAGGLLGGTAGLLAGLGMMAIPVFGPIMAAGPIVVALTGAAVGAGAGGLVGGLIGLGIPEDEAAEYENNVNEGQILVLVDKSAGHRSMIYDVFRNNHASNSRFYDRNDVVSPTIPTTSATPATEHLSTPVDHTVSTDSVTNDSVHTNEDEQTAMLREKARVERINEKVVDENTSSTSTPVNPLHRN
ncbi:general stress protein [Paenibacillus nicotianae]|uniref:General stress protein n=1 Tax=Paenibacillus nicotianae TaxID=1526551 RepID=A0ABW4UWL6_9BACL